MAARVATSCARRNIVRASQHRARVATSCARRNIVRAPAPLAWPASDPPFTKPFVHHVPIASLRRHCVRFERLRGNTNPLHTPARLAFRPSHTPVALNLRAFDVFA
jgi:hypothetical protein